MSKAKKFQENKVVSDIPKCHRCRILLETYKDKPDVFVNVNFGDGTQAA